MDHLQEQDLATFQKYLSNQLHGEEKAAFEQRLAQDAGLQEELEWHKALFNAIEETEDRRLKTLLIEHEVLSIKSDKEAEINPKPRIISIRRWSIAAGILLIIVALALIWTQQRHQKELFEVSEMTASDISRTLINVRSAATGNDANSESISDLSKKDAALVNELYQNGKYQEALAILDTLPVSASILFYQANCLMALNRNSDAIPVLKKVETYTNESYSNFAQWYLALAYYKVGNKELAKEYAEKTIENDGIYENDKEKARKLLKELDKG